MKYGPDETKKNVPVFAHTFPLRLETATHFAVCANVTIPADLTTKDAERLSLWLKALVADWPPEPKEIDECPAPAIMP